MRRRLFTSWVGRAGSRWTDTLYWRWQWTLVELYESEGESRAKAARRGRLCELADGDVALVRLADARPHL